MGYPIVTFGDIPGGIEADVAGALATLGAEVIFVTATPEAPGENATVQRLRALRVNTEFVVQESAGLAAVDPIVFDWDEILADAGWVYLTGLTPGASEAGAAMTLAAAQAANKEELTVFYDLSYRKNLWNWRPGIAPRDLANAATRRILPFVDIVIAGAEDIVQLVRPAEGVTTLNLDTCCNLAAKVAEEFPNIMTVVILLRERAADGSVRLGAMLYDVDSLMAYLAPLNEAMEITPYEIPAAADLAAGDTAAFLAAGDAAFSAGAVYALTTTGLNNGPCAISFAAATAYLRLTQTGEGYPTRAQVEAQMG
ncbi:MAG: carbohydrate kinase family protein [Armatimonadota bacterium]